MLRDDISRSLSKVHNSFTSKCHLARRKSDWNGNNCVRKLTHSLQHNSLTKTAFVVYRTRGENGTAVVVAELAILIVLKGFGYQLIVLLLLWLMFCFLCFLSVSAMLYLQLWLPSHVVFVWIPSHAVLVLQWRLHSKHMVDIPYAIREVRNVIMDSWAVTTTITFPGVRSSLLFDLNIVCMFGLVLLLCV